MNQPQVFRGFADANHDHDRCVSAAIAFAESLCRRRGTRLTPLRRRVLELVWASHRPVKAYDLLEALRENGARPAPPTVYRSLDFLQQEGLVHKVESLSAYVGCGDPGRTHSAQFLICAECGDVGELVNEDLSEALVSGAEAVGFRVSGATVEVHGVCERCRS